MDIAYKRTDAMLQSVEKRLQKEYAQAAREMEQKVKDYYSKYQTKYNAKLKDLNAGKISKAEFVKWNQGQVMIGKRWEEMRDAIATDLTNTNKIAVSAINGHLPEVYALNHNYGTFEVEKGSKVNTSYTLYNRQAVERLVRDNPDLLPKPGVNTKKDIRWNKSNFNSGILQGILQGESIDKIARRVALGTSSKDMAIAIRNARTAFTGAQNAGRMDSYRRAADMGIKIMKQWSAALDSHTRDSHKALDGEEVPYNEEFSNGLMYPGDPDGEPAEVYNCFTGDMLVSTDSNIIRSYKHMYEGELIAIETASGIKFTCTPNHPILTRRGWISANALNDGDDLLIAFVGNNRVSRWNPNVKHGFATFKAVHEFFDKFGGKRVRSLRVNFHGDIPTSDVEIITKKRFLRRNLNTRKPKDERKLLFESTNTFTSGLRHTCNGIRRIFVSSFCFMSGIGKATAFFWSRLRHPEIHSLRPIALFYSGFVKPLQYHVPGDTEIIRNRLDGFAGIICVDNIVNRNISVKQCHVYNLQTKNGYYFVNSIVPDNKGWSNGMGIIAHNCRCAMIADIDENLTNVDPSMIDPDLADMSFDEWEDWHLNGGADQDDDGGLTLDAARTFEAARDYFQKQYGIKVADSVGDLDYDHVKHAMHGIDDTMKEFPELNGQITSLNAESGQYYICTNGSNIILDKSHFTKGRPYGASGAYQAGAHESGHCLDMIICQKEAAKENAFLTESGIKSVARSDWNSNKQARKIVSKAIGNAKKANPAYKVYDAGQMRRSMSLYAGSDTAESLAEAVGYEMLLKNRGVNAYRVKDVGHALGSEIFKIVKKGVSG